MHHPTISPDYPALARIDTGPRRNPGPMSPDSQIAALTVQVAWLTEQLQAQLRPFVPTKLVMTVPELATRWGRDPETIRRMIRRKELRTLRGHRPYEIALGEVYRFESGKITATKIRKGGAA
jgi:hypothetical protein